LRELTQGRRQYQGSGLEDPVEEKPPARGVSAVEAEHEFVKVGPQVLRLITPWKVPTKTRWSKEKTRWKGW